MAPLLRLDIDARAFAGLANGLAAAGKNAPVSLAWGLNAVGNKAATQMRRALVAQTGLRYGVLRRALRTKAATANRLEFRIESKGGDIRLKFFSPRETKAGTSAAPWNHRTLFAGAFMKGGRFPNRVPLNKGNAVFKRVGRSRYPIAEQRSGLFIPEEMVTGASKAAFDQITTRDLEAAAARALYAILSGVTVSARAFR